MGAFANGTAQKRCGICEVSQCFVERHVTEPIFDIQFGEDLVPCRRVSKSSIVGNGQSLRCITSSYTQLAVFLGTLTMELLQAVGLPTAAITSYFSRSSSSSFTCSLSATVHDECMFNNFNCLINYDNTVCFAYPQMPFCQLQGEFPRCERVCCLVDTCSCHAILGYVFVSRLAVLSLRRRQVACSQVLHV